MCDWNHVENLGLYAVSVVVSMVSFRIETYPSMIHENETPSFSTKTKSCCSATIYDSRMVVSKWDKQHNYHSLVIMDKSHFTSVDRQNA